MSQNISSVQSRYMKLEKKESKINTTQVIWLS